MLCWLLFLSSCISFIVLDCDYDKNMVKKKKKAPKINAISFIPWVKKVLHLLCLIFYYQILLLISFLDLPLFLSPLLNSSPSCSPSLLRVTSFLPFCLFLWLPLQAAARTAGAFVWQVQGSGPGSQCGVGPPAADRGAVPGQGPRRRHQTLRAGWRLC